MVRVNVKLVAVVTACAALITGVHSAYRTHPATHSANRHAEVYWGLDYALPASHNLSRWQLSLVQHTIRGIQAAKYADEDHRSHMVSQHLEAVVTCPGGRSVQRCGNSRGLSVRPFIKHVALMVGSVSQVWQ